MMTLSTALLVALFVSLIKPFIDVVVNPGTQVHDTLIRIISIVAAVVGTLVYAYTTNILHTGPELWTQLGNGVQAGLAAILSYHVVTGDFFANSGSSTPDPKPAKIKNDEKPPTKTPLVQSGTYPTMHVEPSLAPQVES